MRRLLVVTAILMSIPGVSYAGGGGVDPSACAGFGEGTNLVMQDSCFAGTAHFVPGDGVIIVENDGQLPHTLTAVDGSFDTGSVAAGSSAELVIGEPGIYRVFCTLHGTAQGAGMAGVLVVGDADTALAQSAGPSEADLLLALEQLGADGSPNQPQIITLNSEVEPAQLVILLLVGLGVGLALAAMLAVLRLRIADGHPATLPVPERSVES